MAKQWSNDELGYLKRYAKSKLLKDLASRFKVDSEEIAAKLEEMGLSAADSVTKIKLEHDPLVKVYEKGVKAMQRSRWADAKKLFEQVLEDGDRRELAARSRQYLELCDNRLGSDGKQKDADPYLEAVVERNRGNFEEALAICTRGGRASKDERFAYLAAAIHAANGSVEDALKYLNTAIELNPKHRIHAYHDTDFEDLQETEEFVELLEAS